MKAPNKKYWIDRSAALEQAIQAEATPAVENIKQAYEQAIRNINADMASVVRGLSKASSITEDEAKKLLNQKESREQYKDLVKLYDETTDERAKKDIALRINRQAYGARMTRLEALKLNVYKHLMYARNAEQEVHAALHKETLQRSYYSNIHNIAKGFDVGIIFSVLPKKAIDKTLSAKWLGSNYSKRIWNNNQQFIEKVQRTITDGITAGHSISRMSDKLLDYVAVENKGQRYIAERLARSETAHFMAQGQLEAYKEAGIEYYQFVAAFSERTCDICGGLDGEIKPVSQARAGDNYPPIHANCRCTTVLAGYPSNTRIARDPETGRNYRADGNMTYSEWKRSLTPEQAKAMNTHVRQMRNASSDKILYEKYSQIFGQDFPKTLDDFVEMKYNSIQEWDGFKAEKQDRLNQMNFEDMSGLVGKLGNKEVRLWYKSHDENIINLIDTLQPLEQQARQAYELRNQYRFEARELMKNQQERKELDKEKTKTFEQLVEHKKREYGLSGDDIYRDIIRSSGTTNREYDKKAGVD